jgi:hypothetical protein
MSNSEWTYRHHIIHNNPGETRYCFLKSGQDPLVIAYKKGVPKYTLQKFFGENPEPELIRGTFTTLKAAKLAYKMIVGSES